MMVGPDAESNDKCTSILILSIHSSVFSKIMPVFTCSEYVFIFIHVGDNS